jgi:hypothetical protein
MSDTNGENNGAMAPNVLLDQLAAEFEKLKTEDPQRFLKLIREISAALDDLNSSVHG